MTEYWGGTIHFFLLTLYNFKNIGGARAPSPPPPLLRGPCFKGIARAVGFFKACTQLDKGCYYYQYKNNPLPNNE